MKPSPALQLLQVTKDGVISSRTSRDSISGYAVPLASVSVTTQSVLAAGTPSVQPANTTTSGRWAAPQIAKLSCGELQLGPSVLTSCKRPWVQRASPLSTYLLSTITESCWPLHQHPMV